jgi:hypothetical protein
MSINILPKKEVGPYTYCVGPRMDLTPIMDSRCEVNVTPVDTHIFRLMISFTSCLTAGKTHKCITFPKCMARLSYCLIVSPSLGNASMLNRHITTLARFLSVI